MVSKKVNVNQQKMVEQKHMCSFPPVRVSELQLAVEQSETGEHQNSPEKDTPHSKKKKPQQDGMKDSIKIKSNPISGEWVTHKLENDSIKEVLQLL